MMLKRRFLLVTLALGAFSCKPRLPNTKLQADQDEQIATLIEGSCLGDSTMAASIFINANLPRELERDTRKKQKLAAAADLYVKVAPLFDSKTKTWSAAKEIWDKTPILYRKESDKIASYLVYAHEVRIPVQTGEKTHDLEILLNERQAVRSPFLVRHFLAQNQAGFYTGLDVRPRQFGGNAVLGFNLFGDRQEYFAQAAAAPLLSALIFGASPYVIKPPIYWIIPPFGDINVTGDSNLLKFGDVFVKQLGSGQAYGSGFGIWLSDKVVVDPEALVFASLKETSHAAARELLTALKSEQSTDAGGFGWKEGTAGTAMVNRVASTPVGVEQEGESGDYLIFGERIARAKLDHFMLVHDLEGKIASAMHTCKACQSVVPNVQGKSLKQQFTELALRFRAAHAAQTRYAEVPLVRAAKLTGDLKTATTKEFNELERFEADLTGQKGESRFTDPTMYDEIRTFVTASELAEKTELAEKVVDIERTAEEASFYSREMGSYFYKIFSILRPLFPNVRGEKLVATLAKYQEAYDTLFPDEGANTVVLGLASVACSEMAPLLAGSNAERDEQLAKNTQLSRMDSVSSIKSALARWAKGEGAQALVADAIGSGAQQRMIANPREILRDYPCELFYAIDAFRVDHKQAAVKDPFPIRNPEKTFLDYRIGWSRQKQARFTSDLSVYSSLLARSYQSRTDAAKRLGTKLEELAMSL